MNYIKNTFSTTKDIFLSNAVIDRAELLYKISINEPQHLLNYLSKKKLLKLINIKLFFYLINLG